MALSERNFQYEANSSSTQKAFYALNAQDAPNVSFLFNSSLETVILTDTNASFIVENQTQNKLFSGDNSEFIFDRLDIQVLLIAVYVTVFITGFAGKFFYRVI